MLLDSVGVEQPDGCRDNPIPAGLHCCKSVSWRGVFQNSPSVGGGVDRSASLPWNLPNPNPCLLPNPNPFLLPNPNPILLPSPPPSWPRVVEALPRGQHADPCPAGCSCTSHAFHYLRPRRGTSSACLDLLVDLGAPSQVLSWTALRRLPPAQLQVRGPPACMPLVACPWYRGPGPAGHARSPVLPPPNSSVPPCARTPGCCWSPPKEATLTLSSPQRRNELHQWPVPNDESRRSCQSTLFHLTLHSSTALPAYHLDPYVAHPSSRISGGGGRQTERMVLALHTQLKMPETSAGAISKGAWDGHTDCGATHTGLSHSYLGCTGTCWIGGGTT